MVVQCDGSTPVRMASTWPWRDLLWRGVASLILIVLGGWVVYTNWPLRSIRFNALSYTETEAWRLRNYPGAQYGFGMQALIDQQPEKAATFFHNALSRNVIFVDAWLRLAETQVSMEREANARKILTFVDRMTERVLRWKWPQMVLASQLAMNDIVFRNANDLLTRGTLQQDTLQLLHIHLDGNASAVLERLAPQNRAAYLDWLMRWGMAQESLTVWQAMTADAPADKTLALRYAHFLLGHKRVNQAADIWRHYTGNDTLTNSGFENEITGRGFDWRCWGEKAGHWKFKRVFSESVEGNYALRLNFNGKANIAFYHLYQIVAVIPNATYRLTYAWKTSGITTDQGPYVEIIDFDSRAMLETGMMMSGTHAWHDDRIDFSVPPDCRAVVVRLRRKTSMRFDSKIRGKIWLDNFRLEKETT